MELVPGTLERFSTGEATPTNSRLAQTKFSELFCRSSVGEASPLENRLDDPRRYADDGVPNTANSVWVAIWVDDSAKLRLRQRICQFYSLWWHPDYQQLTACAPKYLAGTQSFASGDLCGSDY